MIAKESLNLNAVADRFDISRPAISRHIKILTECGLIAIKQEGRERYCKPRLQKLNEVSNWVEQYRIFWTSKFDALEKFLSDTEPSSKKNISTKKNKRK